MQLNSAILGNVDLTPRQYSTQDDQQFAQAGKLLRDNRLDLFTADGAKRSLELMDEWFQAHRSVPVSVESIFRAVEERKQDFTWLTPAQHAWYSAAEANPQLANDLATYVAGTSGRPGSFIKDGDPLFENLLGLFKELQSRREPVSAQSIAHAENRIANRPGPKLKYVAAERRTTPVSPAAKEMSDYDPKQQVSALFGDMVKNADGSWRSKTFAEQRADREAAEAAAQPTEREQLSADEAYWKSKAESALSFGTHGQQEAIRQVFNQTSGSWRQRFEAVNKVVNMYKRSGAIS